MMWSKLKQRVEERFADDVKGRVEFFQTRYRKSHDQLGEFWLTIDGEKIHGVGDRTFFAAEHVAITEILSDEDYQGTSSHAQRDVWDGLSKGGIESVGRFNNGLREALNMSVDELLAHEYPIMRFIGVLDKRCGKRRIAKMNRDDEHELVQRAIQLRRV